MDRQQPYDLLVRSTRAVLPDGERPATIAIRDGVIADIAPHDWQGCAAGGRIDAGEAAILPGIVDTHVHVNDPGTDWEGFHSAGRAAAAGGITTIIDMPLNSDPVTVNVLALRDKRRAAARHCHVDYAFWGGVVPGNLADLLPLLDAGVRGFKCFLCPSGLDAFGHVGEAELRPAMGALASRGAVLLAHAEDPRVLEQAAAAARPGDAPRSYAAYLASRPPLAEAQAIELLARLSADSGCRVHVVHVASAEGVDAVAAARAQGLPMTAETCPHYLTFVAERIADGATAFKCAPPIRESRHREALWQGLATGLLDLVASDHSPCPLALKCLDEGDFTCAWGGIASLQLSLSATWTEARARGFGLQQVAQWMATAPARLAGFEASKGALRPGVDADLLIFDPDSTFLVASEALQHRHALTPYDGMPLDGIVERTFVRGKAVYDRRRFADHAGGIEVSHAG